MTTTTLREFIIVGQCQGTGYTLWDAAPAPTDPARRAAVLEELGVEAADAFGSVETEHGANAREAVENFLADMRRQSGLDDYGLTADSRTDCLGPDLPKSLVTTVLTRACETSAREADLARAVLLRDTIHFAARLIRDVLPTAAAITVDIDDTQLFEVRDEQEETLWFGPAAGPGHLLNDQIVHEVETLLRKALPFGGLEDAGWEQSKEGRYYRDVQLPDQSTPAWPVAVAHVRHEATVCDVEAKLTEAEHPSFILLGLDGEPMRETADRVRAAIINAGYAWPDGAMHVQLKGTGEPGSTADLAIACAILAAAGHVHPACLKRTVLLGELALDGKVRVTPRTRYAVRYAAGGFKRAVVASTAATTTPLIPGGTVYGVLDLRQALAFIARTVSP
ncbi:magnesium chelatase domain-containing protein [Streptomyces sp. NPDC046881]|uniref:magnesium chelatase domain-containing protein n=1 Tax=Streptomyces sp. NPDC046881 TaxID=3155374 RepID=UPI0033DC310D